MEKFNDNVQFRDEAFVKKTSTKIWKETASPENPYIAKSAACHGYDLFSLLENASYIDVFYLLFYGELPSKDQSKLLERLMIGLINPGPRHPASRAAMNAGVGKTLTQHILPIATAVMGGEYMGGHSVSATMKFLCKHYKNSNPETIADQWLLRLSETNSNELSSNSLDDLGFGSIYGGVDCLTSTLASSICCLDEAGPILHWAHEFVIRLNREGMGWLPSGLAAAVFAEIGFKPKIGCALFQLVSSPGLAAHGLELASKPLSAMPFVSDENYFFE